MIKPLKECPVCKGIGWRIIKNNYITESQPERWIRIPCLKCKGVGFVRE